MPERRDMAVYTEVTDQDLARFVARYGLGKLLSYKGIAEGVENTNYAVHTERGSYILTLYEKRVDPDDLPFFLGLMDHLAANGLSCPVPVRDPTGRMLGELAGRPAALVTFLEGVWPRRPTVANCEAVGIALARLHLASHGFEIKRKNGLGLANWRPLFDQFAAQADAIAPALRQTISAELDHLEGLWPRHLPDGVIHADLFQDNVFFLGDQLSGLIDFYFACNDALAYDVAVCLNAWCFDSSHAYDRAKGAALLAGYQSVRRLEPRELEALPLLARGAALRFLLTRAYDWINTPPGALVQRKDPLEYLVKLRFHQSVATASGYGAA
jgi:homoserine kinase type II